MRVVLAPDGFGSTLTAAEAVAAMADGWGSARPDDVLVPAPQSDGGPGFVDVLATAFKAAAVEENDAAAAGFVRTARISGPLGAQVESRRLVVGGTVYIESAQGCGLHLLGGRHDPATAWSADSHGAGELILAAVRDGATRVVVGLGGSACTDGGAGAASAFGGPAAMREALAGVDVVAASDVRNPMFGPDGAAAVFGPQKGADATTIARLDARLRRWCAELEDATGVAVADLAGAGAAGGLGGLLLAVGGRMVPGATIVGESTGRAREIAMADVVVTGEGRVDLQSQRGKVVSHVIGEAVERATRVVVIAGQVEVDEPTWRSWGADAVWSVSDVAGSVEASMADPARSLSQAARVAAAGTAAAGTAGARRGWRHR